MAAGNTPIWEARVCSIAAGHGRNWGQGAVTACYGPLLLGTCEVQSEVTQLLALKQSNGNNHPPPTLLPLVRPILGSQEGSAEVVFYNGGDASLAFSWRLQADGEAAWQTATLGAGEMEQNLI